MKVYSFPTNLDGPDVKPNWPGTMGAPVSLAQLGRAVSPATLSRLHRANPDSQVRMWAYHKDLGMKPGDLVIFLGGGAIHHVGRVGVTFETLNNLDGRWGDPSQPMYRFAATYPALVETSDYLDYERYLAIRGLSQIPRSPNVIDNIQDEGLTALLEFLSPAIEALNEQEPPDAGVAWDLEPGTTIKRTELHDRFGGNRQGGIAPSAKTNSIMIFTDSTAGAQHGYVDEWHDGVFLYTGEGQRGDQTFTHGNRALRDAFAENQHIRLFEGVRGTVEYVGEFALDAAHPYEFIRTSQNGSDELRSAIRFRLMRVGEVETEDHLSTAPLGERYRHADDAKQFAAPQTRSGPGDTSESSLQHRRLQNGLADGVAAAGLVPLSPRADSPDYDLAWYHDGSEDAMTVVEVKSFNKRNEVRQLRIAVGQVLDYRNKVQRRGKRVRALIYIPRRPADDRWLEIARDANIEIAWPARDIVWSPDI